MIGPPPTELFMPTKSGRMHLFAGADSEYMDEVETTSF